MMRTLYYLKSNKYGIFYVGGTFGSLSERLRQHKIESLQKRGTVYYTKRHKIINNSKISIHRIYSQKTEKEIIRLYFQLGHPLTNIIGLLSEERIVPIHRAKKKSLKEQNIMSKKYKAFGLHLLKIRKAKKLSQIWVAKKCKIKQPYLSQIESGKKLPSLDVLEQIAKIYKLPVTILTFPMFEKRDIAKNKQAIFSKLQPLIAQIIDEEIIPNLNTTNGHKATK